MPAANNTAAIAVTTAVLVPTLHFLNVVLWCKVNAPNMTRLEHDVHNGLLTGRIDALTGLCYLVEVRCGRITQNSVVSQTDRYRLKRSHPC